MSMKAKADMDSWAQRVQNGEATCHFPSEALYIEMREAVFNSVLLGLAASMRPSRLRHAARRLQLLPPTEWQLLTCEKGMNLELNRVRITIHGALCLKVRRTMPLGSNYFQESRMN